MDNSIELVVKGILDSDHMFCFVFYVVLKIYFLKIIFQEDILYDQEDIKEEVEKKIYQLNFSEDVSIIGKVFYVNGCRFYIEDQEDYVIVNVVDVLKVKVEHDVIVSVHEPFYCMVTLVVEMVNIILKDS